MLELDVLPEAIRHVCESPDVKPFMIKKYGLDTYTE